MEKFLQQFIQLEEEEGKPVAMIMAMGGKLRGLQDYFLIFYGTFNASSEN